jgi:hypothetical protein
MNEYKTSLLKIKLRAICCIVFLGCCLQTATFADEQTRDEKYWLPAVGNTLLSNSILYMFNRYVGKFEFAMVSAESVWYNLQSTWVWDQDVFITNQFGHPYQGATYYVAAIYTVL